MSLVTWNICFDSRSMVMPTSRSASSASASGVAARSRVPPQRLNFLPLPQGQGSFRPILFKALLSDPTPNYFRKQLVASGLVLPKVLLACARLADLGPDCFLHTVLFQMGSPTLASRPKQTEKETRTIHICAAH